MTEIYSLTEVSLPTIPVPHDCIVNDIRLEENTLTLVFEPDISYHDGISHHHPNAKTLIMRIRLAEGEDGLECYRYKMRKSGKEGYDLITKEKVVGIHTERIDYLYHYVGYRTIIIKLFSFALNCMMLEIQAERVEMDWIEA